MTAYSDFLDNIRTWVVHPEYDDNLVDSFVRSAESNLNRQMRVKEMIEIDDAIVTTRRVTLPSGWQELDTVRLNDSEPLTYVSRSDFYGRKQPLTDKYTIVGNYILFGSDNVNAIDGYPVELSYYKAVPHLSVSDTTWLHDNYYDIYLQACLVPAYLYGQETDRSLAVSTYVGSLITDANDKDMIAKVSGSQLKMPRSRMRIG